MSTKLAKCQTKTYQLSNEPWSTLPCSKNGCTAQTHQPSGQCHFVIVHAVHVMKTQKSVLRVDVLTRMPIKY